MVSKEFPALVPGVDQVLGSLRVVPRPGTPGAGERKFVAFRDINVILYLSSWVVTGSAVTASGVLESFSLRVEDETNTVYLNVGRLQWAIRYPGNHVQVRNDITNRRLSIIFERPVFSENEPIWFVERDSVIHVQKGEQV